VASAMQLLNFRRTRQQRFSVASPESEALPPTLLVTVWERVLPVREVHQNDDPKCNGTTNGAFVAVSPPHRKWPLRDHYLDVGIAKCAARLATNSSFLDIGGGSGQYGAYFHMLQATAEEAPLRITLWGTPKPLVVNPGATSGMGPTAWTIIDGTPGIEEYTRTFGPKGSLVAEANLCNRSLRLPVHDWVMSLEVSCIGFKSAHEACGTCKVIPQASQVVCQSCTPPRPMLTFVCVCRSVSICRLGAWPTTWHFSTIRIEKG
jgi:hypothetical protein